jgi:hypothetical protein
MNELEKKIQAQFGVEDISHSPYNVYSFMFMVQFSPYLHTLVEVEKVPEVDCFLLTQSGYFAADEGISILGVVRYTLNTEKELLGKIKEVLEDYNKVSDLLNKLYTE